MEDDLNENHEYSLESENMEEHKSLILHLLSKLKLGMDLTKVSVDTFSAYSLVENLSTKPFSG